MWENRTATQSGHKPSEPTSNFGSCILPHYFSKVNRNFKILWTYTKTDSIQIYVYILYNILGKNFYEFSTTKSCKQGDLNQLLLRSLKKTLKISSIES